MKNSAIILFLLLALVSIGFIRPSDRFFEISKNLDVFASLVKELDRYYVDSTNVKKLTRRAIYGMLENYDPYTNFIPEEELEDFRTSTTGEYAGIGAQISQIDSGIYISMIYENFAAHRAGLRIGDQIVEVNNQPITKTLVSNVSAKLKGKPSSEVSLKVMRHDLDAPLSFTIKREKISVNSVPYYDLLENSIGYIYLEEFTTGASREVKEALQELKSLGAQSIILDLRDNPGGLLSEAVNVSNVFIPKNKLIVETKGRREEWNRSYKTLGNSVDDSIPLAILVNGGSASAAEIVAGAVQDYDRGILLGAKTFGKGLVQTTRPISYGNQVKITTAKYYIPSGRCIQSIDYSQKNDSLNHKIIDTAIVDYKTKAGRLVYGGSGLQPDIDIHEKDISAFTSRLIDEGVIFKYCRALTANRNVDGVASDNHLNAFMTWLDNVEFNRSLGLTESIENIRVAAKKEKKYDELNSYINKLEKKLVQVDTKQFDNNREEILKVLNIELQLHIGGLSENIKKRLQYDQAVKQAVIYLNDVENYKLVLSKH